MVATRNKPPADLAHRVGEFLAARLVPAERLCVGLSGGCDSVVLLHLLSRLEFGDRLCAMHVHHGLSPNADDWARFCAEYCGRLSIFLEIARVDVDLNAQAGPEAAARAARYAALGRCAAPTLVLAHHQGDQAETLLFNLLRGAGVAGAAAMRVERKRGQQRVLRPLLGVSRAELEAYAKAHGLCWIDDESNLDTRYSRNFLRHEIMPRLRSRFPGAELSLAQAATHFGEADALLAELAEQDWCAVSQDAAGSASLQALRQLSPARLKNLLRYRLRALGWQAPVTARLDEFVRQLRCAGPDRHPELQLAEGSMRIARGRLCWLAQK